MAIKRMKKFLTFVFLLVSILVVNAQEQSSIKEQPKVIKAIAPKYPPAAVAVKAESQVIIDVKVNQNGEVVSADVKSGHPLLRKISENAAKKWLFEPFTNSKSNQKATLIFSFRFSKDKKDEAVTVFKQPFEMEVVSDWYIYNEIAVK
jgi:hypothetical protein